MRGEDVETQRVSMVGSGSGILLIGGSAALVVTEWKDRVVLIVCERSECRGYKI